MTTCIMKEMCNNGKVELVCKPNELQTLDQRGRGEVNPNNHAIYYKPPPHFGAHGPQFNHNTSNSTLTLARQYLGN